jgi:hypothetical protein
VPDFSHVNWLAVIIAAVAQIVLGYIWYLPMLFGKRYEAETGRTLGNPTPMTIGYMVVAALLAAVGLAIFSGGGIEITDGAIRAALLWLYFVVPVSAAAIFFEGRSWMWWIITAGYWLVGLVIMGAIIAYMPAM